MDMYVQSLAATRVDPSLRRWIPAHAVWMEFGQSHDYDRGVTTMGNTRTTEVYPKNQHWTPRPCKLLRLGVEWMYAIMQSEYQDEQVFALSVSTILRLQYPVDGVPFRLFHQPCVIQGADLAAARQAGIRQAQAWWPKADGYLSWGVKAWHVSADWFRQSIEDEIALGVLTMNRLENTYAHSA